MNDGDMGVGRSPLDVAFFAVCFLAVIFIAAGIITGSVWVTVLGFLLGLAGLGHFLISQWL